uniref:Uncharacterized protein n=1 Tax=Parascaris univalens TaxID=6257 RepID=A0A915C7L4_PARUN
MNSVENKLKSIQESTSLQAHLLWIDFSAIGLCSTINSNPLRCPFKEKNFST